MTVLPGVRNGSRQWFTERKWTVARLTWNCFYSDVIELKTTDKTSIVFEQHNTTWEINEELSSVSITPELLADIKLMLTPENVEMITTDNVSCVVLAKSKPRK